MYKVLYLPVATFDLTEVNDYLYEFSISAAENFLDSLEQFAKRIADFPKLYPPYERDLFFRKAVLGDFLLFYSVDDARLHIIIHRIFHHSRDIDHHLKSTRKNF